MRAILAGGAAILLLVAGGCNPPDNGGNTDNTVVLTLGATGVFEGDLSSAVQTGAFFDITADLPTSDRESATVSVDPADITVDLGTSGAPIAISLLVFVAPGAADDPCQTSPDFSLFNITVDSNGTVTVDPQDRTISEGNFAVVDTGTFGLCLVASAERDVDFTLRQISLSFAPPGPVSANSCEDVLALPEVQDALALLDSNGVRFRVPSGDVTVDLAGGYTLDETVTFDPDETDVGDSQDGAITLRNQSAGEITRAGLGGSVDFF